MTRSQSSDELDLAGFYALHEAGELDGNDRRWLEMQRQLNAFCRKLVYRKTGHLCPEERERKYEDVAACVLAKFIGLKFSGADNFNTLLGTVVNNELMSSIRRHRSVNTEFHGSIEDEYGVVGPVESDDSGSLPGHEVLFETVRSHLRPFRFPEHNLAREAILIYFLMTNKLPGHAYLRSLRVHRTLSMAVYNSAIVDINRAILLVSHAAN